MVYQKKNTGLLLCALSLCACAAAALLALRNCDSGERITVSLSAAAIFVLGSLGLRRVLWGKAAKMPFFIANVLLFLALCARLIAFSQISPDYELFLSEWMETFRSMSVREAMVTPVGDYNMPYLYFLILLSRLPVSPLYGIKLLSCAADVALALGLAKLTQRLTKDELRTLLVFCAVLLAPSVLMNSAYWGQCDSIYTALSVWGIYALLTDRPYCSLALFALAFSFKLQTVFLLPVLLFFFQEDRIRWKHIPMFPLVFVLCLAPALLFGRTLSDTLSIYFQQTMEYRRLSLNAPSFWALYPTDAYNQVGSIALLLCACAAMLILLLLLTAGDRHALTDADAISIALIFALVIPWLLPKMHERYFYAAEMLSIVYAALYPKRMWIAATLLLGGALSYNVYLFAMDMQTALKIFAIAYGVIAAFITSSQYKAMTNDKNALEEKTI